MTHVGLRVGLIGAGVALLVATLSLIPLVGNLLIWLFGFLLWVAQGILVAYWRNPHHEDTEVAWAAALAGFIAALVQGLTTVLLAPVGLFLLGGTQGAIRLLPDVILAAYQQIGIAPSVLFSTVGVFLVTLLTCGLQFFIAPLVAALSAVLLARWWSEPADELWEDTPYPPMLEW